MQDASVFYSYAALSCDYIWQDTFRLLLRQGYDSDACLDPVDLLIFKNFYFEESFLPCLEKYLL